jgi:ABC-type branched-subunit amino acid transport system ATPase component
MSEEVDWLLNIANLSVAYSGGRIVAVRDLTVRLDRGGLAAIIGPNGAGKTSTLQAVAGAIGTQNSRGFIMDGTVTLDGTVLNGKQPNKISDLGIALVPEQGKVFLELTPLEHFRLTPSVPRTAIPAAIDRVLEFFPDLKPHVKRPAGFLSGGQRQMLGIATALIAEPRLLMIDEFSQGLAPIIVDAFVASLRSINSAGTTILLVEQNPTLAMSLADGVTILDAGRVVASAPAAQLRGSDHLMRSYLGAESTVGGTDG